LCVAACAHGLCLRAGTQRMNAPYSNSQLIRDAAKSSQDCGPSFGIAGADDRYGAGMAKYPPIALGALYCGRRAGALEGITCDQTVLGQIERHGDKISYLTHVLS
jgi:hypothetical protein